MASLTAQRNKQKQQQLDLQQQKERELVEKQRDLNKKANNSAIKSNDGQKSAERRLSYEELLQLAERNKLEASKQASAKETIDIKSDVATCNSDVTSKKKTISEKVAAVSTVGAAARPVKPSVTKPDLNTASRRVTVSGNERTNSYTPSVRPSASRNVPKQAISKMFKTKKASAVDAYAKNQAVTLNTVKRDLRTIEEIQEDIQRRKKLKNGSQDAQKRNSNEKLDSKSTSSASKPAMKQSSTTYSDDFEKPVVKKRGSNEKLTSQSSSSAKPEKKPVVKQPTKPKSDDAEKPVIKKQRTETTPSKETQKPKSATKKVVVGKNEAFEVYEDSYVKRNVSSIISDLFGGKKRNQYADDDFEDDNMEASAREIEFEERRTARIGKLEDKREEELQRQEALKLKKKRKEKA